MTDQTRQSLMCKRLNVKERRISVSLLTHHVWVIDGKQLWTLASAMLVGTHYQTSVHIKLPMQACSEIWIRVSSIRCVECLGYVSTSFFNSDLGSYFALSCLTPIALLLAGTINMKRLKEIPSGSVS